MSFSLILNSSNVANSSNSTYSYSFPSGGFTIEEGMEISLASLSLPYSWFNVSNVWYNNGNFSYRWVNGTVYNITLDPGFYQCSDINNALQNAMIQNRHYLVNTATGNNLYYLALAVDINAYANQILAFPVPMSLPAGYTAPVGGFTYASGAVTTPQIVIGSNNFGSLIGFSPASYPPTPLAIKRPLT